MDRSAPIECAIWTNINVQWLSHACANEALNTKNETSSTNHNGYFQSLFEYSVDSRDKVSSSGWVDGFPMSDFRFVAKIPAKHALYIVADIHIYIHEKVDGKKTVDINWKAKTVYV